MKLPTEGAARVETSAGGVIFRRNGNDARVLLIRDAYRRWGLPKGHIEPGETAEIAAMREVEEETGLTDLRLAGFLQTVDWHFDSGRGAVHKFCHFYLIESPSGDAVPRTEEGITACTWLTIPQAVERISYHNTRAVIRLAAEQLGLPASTFELQP